MLKKLRFPTGGIGAGCRRSRCRDTKNHSTEVSDMTQVAKRTMRNAWRLWRSRCLFTFAVAGLSLLTFAFGCSGAKGTMPSAEPTGSVPAVTRQADSISMPQMGVFKTLWGDRFIIMRSVDSQGHKLKYRLIVKGGSGGSTVFDQGVNPQGWLTNPFRSQTVSEYNSGQWAWFKFPLPEGVYEFQAQAYHDNLESLINNPPLKVRL